MRTIYELDNARVWTGNSRVIANNDGRPKNWVQSDIDPPAKEFSRWRGGAWIVLTEYPQVSPPVPEVVSMAAAREALIDADKLGAVESAIDAIDDDIVKAKARAWWEYSVSVRRESKWIAMLAPAVPLTDEEVDQLFIAADEIDQNA